MAPLSGPYVGPQSKPCTAAWWIVRTTAWKPRLRARVPSACTFHMFASGAADAAMLPQANATNSEIDSSASSMKLTTRRSVLPSRASSTAVRHRGGEPYSSSERDAIRTSGRTWAHFPDAHRLPHRRTPTAGSSTSARYHAELVRRELAGRIRSFGSQDIILLPWIRAVLAVDRSDFRPIADASGRRDTRIVSGGSQAGSVAQVRWETLDEGGPLRRRQVTRPDIAAGYAT